MGQIVMTCLRTQPAMNTSVYIGLETRPGFIGKNVLDDPFYFLIREAGRTNLDALGQSFGRCRFSGVSQIGCVRGSL